MVKKIAIAFIDWIFIYGFIRARYHTVLLIITFLCAFIFMAGILFYPAPGHCDSKKKSQAAAYEALESYCYMWNTDECYIMPYYLHQAEALKKAMLLFNDRCGENSAGEKAFFKILDNFDGLFNQLSSEEKKTLEFRFSSIDDLKKMTKVISCSAYYFASRGSGEAALKALIVMLSYLNDIEIVSVARALRSPDPNGNAFGDKVISGSCYEGCLRAVLKVMSISEFNEETLLFLLKAIGNIEKSMQGYGPALKLAEKESALMIETIALLDSSRFNGEDRVCLLSAEDYHILTSKIAGSPFAANLVRLYAREGIRQLTHAFSVAASVLENPGIETLAALGAIDEKIRKGEYNNFFTLLCIPVFHIGYKLGQKVFVYFDFVKIASCVRIYKHKKGAFPSGLDSAFDCAGVKMPFDRFTGKRYNYGVNEAGGFFVISPGSDGKADLKPENINDIIAGVKENNTDDMALTEKGSR